MVVLSRNGIKQADFVYDERSNLISTKYANGTYTAYEYDELSRLKSLKNYNAAGAVLDSYSYSYDANRNITSIVTAAGTISYVYDEQIKLYYLMARHYDAENGRFLTKDTFHGFEDDPQSLNQYAYGRNNPILYVDPSGRAPLEPYFLMSG